MSKSKVDQSLKVPLRKTRINVADQSDPLPRNRTWFKKRILSLKNWWENRIARHSIYGNPPVYDPALFPWAKELEQEWKVIRKELDQVLSRRSELADFHEITKEVETITRDRNWKTFFLMGYGMACDDNAERCPRTVQLLQKVPGIQTAFFSILSPDKYIPPHRGPYNGVLRYHLGLKIPKPRDRCYIQVADQTLHWEEGQSLIFDDCFKHEAKNGTDDYRVVLFVDFLRPLAFPFNYLNRLVIHVAKYSSQLRQARKNHQRWSKRFYERD